VYGRPVLRREERFGELAAELPWLRDELGTDAPADDEEVVLEGEQLVGGEPRARGGQAQRDSAIDGRVSRGSGHARKTGGGRRREPAAEQHALPQERHP
jgi:hypothetical protein